MPEMNEENGVVSASETVGGEIANQQDQNFADSEHPRTEPAPGRLPARASRTGDRETLRFRL